MKIPHWISKLFAGLLSQEGYADFTAAQRDKQRLQAVRIARTNIRQNRKESGQGFKTQAALFSSKTICRNCMNRRFPDSLIPTPL